MAPRGRSWVHEEARVVGEMNAANPGVRITLAGSTVHNADSFLGELARLGGGGMRPPPPPGGGASSSTAADRKRNAAMTSSSKLQ